MLTVKISKLVKDASLHWQTSSFGSIKIRMLYLHANVTYQSVAHAAPHGKIVDNEGQTRWRQFIARLCQAISFS